MRRIIIVILCLLFSSPVWAATRFVDKGCATSSYNPTGTQGGTACSGGSYTSYTTIQAAINAANVGDTIYMRGGTYTERNIDLGSKSGTAWTDGNYYKLASCPASVCGTDEWAIINATSGSTSDHGITGFGASFDPISASEYGDPNGYWWFERFEVRNAPNSGFILEKGPFKFRYLYIHDNCASMGSNDLCGGIRINMSRDSTVEYCRFANNGVNGVNTNNANVEMQADYRDSSGNGSALNSSICPKNNTIRYNYITGAGQGIRLKGDQRFGYNNRDPNGIYAYEDYGDKIHHNIVFSGWAPIMYGEDFVQIYNNITDKTIGVAKWEDGCPILYNQCVYNNTVKSSALSYWIRGARTADCLAFNDYHGTIAHPYVWFYNNISSGTGSGYHELPFMIAWDIPANAQKWDASDAVLERNLIHDADYSLPITVGHDYSYSGCQTQEYSASTFNSCSATWRGVGSVLNWDQNGTLFQSGSGIVPYMTISAFAFGGYTIANGGKGGSHPYLSGVSIPSYVGANNPDDDDWVDGVYTNLSDTTWLRSTSTNRDVNDDPTWIEGASPPGYVTPPPPLNLHIAGTSQN